ncbi:MAG: FHA domain-containing protein [Pseudomonadales bacterium]|nr:FHA domain-containing protein [Pseudomonadales bacterium]
MSQPGMPSTGWELKADQHSLPGKMYSIAAINIFAKKSFPINECTVIGRDPACTDVTLPGTHVSRRHAELTLQDDQLFVRDLGSANGTFINGRKITEGLAQPGDEIRFDTIALRVVSPEGESDKTVLHPRSKPFVEDTILRPTRAIRSEESEEIIDIPISALDRFLPQNLDVKMGIIISLGIIAVSAIIIALAK